MSAINEIAEKYNFEIFEDSAQALGARFKGKMQARLVQEVVLAFILQKFCCWRYGAAVCNDYETYEKVNCLGITEDLKVEKLSSGI